MNTEERIKFRKTKTWQLFRIRMLLQGHNTCQLCGTEYSGRQTKMLHVHHINPDNYSDLNPNNFRLVCATCHKYIIERFIKKKSWGKFAPEWYELLKHFGLKEKI